MPTSTNPGIFPLLQRKFGSIWPKQISIYLTRRYCSRKRIVYAAELLVKYNKNNTEYRARSHTQDAKNPGMHRKKVQRSHENKLVRGPRHVRIVATFVRYCLTFAGDSSTTDPFIIPLKGDISGIPPPPPRPPWAPSSRFNTASFPAGEKIKMSSCSRSGENCPTLRGVPNSPPSPPTQTPPLVALQLADLATSSRPT